MDSILAKEILINMAEKYYTPTIEEFHVGFEYEEFWNDQWNKRIYSIDSFICDGSQDEPYEIEEINPNFHRVKYLDKDDFEALLFETTATYGDFIECNMSNIGLLFNTESKIISIEIKHSPYATQPVFYGTVKNKSELIKVLNQVVS